MVKTRVRLLLLWALCVAVSPFLLLAQFLQALAGSETRALSMAVAQDECGNALTGGDPAQTISARAGQAYLDGKRWGKIAAPCIDFFFGPGHCVVNAQEYAGRFNRT